MYIADLHIHSRYSMATSKFLTPEYLDLWAKKKGIHILGTGDFTHPLWREELKEKLEPAEPGLYKLKPELRLPEIPSGSFDPRFMISGEISTIYKKNGRAQKMRGMPVTRRSHSIKWNPPGVRQKADYGSAAQSAGPGSAFCV